MGVFASGEGEEMKEETKEESKEEEGEQLIREKDEHLNVIDEEPTHEDEDEDESSL